MEPSENVLLEEVNDGGFRLAIVARFEDPYPVQYKIRVSKPRGVSIDYMSTLEGFKKFGELLTALHYFAQTKLYPQDPEKLREVLTAENIKNFAEVLKSARFSV